ncbi:phosphodiester glycosidase family protein [Allochromatium palmeri]|uniref:Phosphodiester glycosidase family protein n=2 Tax=Allochromatium palmeri TaxID=231048 RepID=A0A6N8EH78_9GAMM|nr:phosphodiester glycosidase family protein [Allochromatium palmeri]
MLLSLLVFWLMFDAWSSPAQADWRPQTGEPWPAPEAPISHHERTLESSTGRTVRAHLALFDSRRYRLAVLDLGAELAPASAWPEHMRAAGLLAAVNGGFFHADGQPLGLVIAEGTRLNRFETAKLLSGVLYGDARGIHLERRVRFQLRTGIDALVQSGPYLVEHGRAVRGLSTNDVSRRTFIATDWRRHWVLGATRDGLTLAELAEALSTPGALAPWAVERALNLDGGTSTGFLFDPGAGQAPIQVRARRPVRTLVGVRAR